MHGEPTRDIKMPCRSMTHVKSSITAKADGELPDFYDAGCRTKEVLPFLKPPTRRFTHEFCSRGKMCLSKPPTRRFTTIAMNSSSATISKPPTRRFTCNRLFRACLCISKPPTRRFTQGGGGGKEISAQCKTLWDFGFRTYDARLKSMIFRNRYSSSAIP